MPVDTLLTVTTLDALHSAISDKYPELEDAICTVETEHRSVPDTIWRSGTSELAVCAVSFRTSVSSPAFQVFMHSHENARREMEREIEGLFRVIPSFRGVSITPILQRLGRKGKSCYQIGICANFCIAL